MRKTLFIILSVLGICTFISCKEQKHPTIDEELSQPTIEEPSQTITEEPSQTTTEEPSQTTTEEPLQTTTDGPSQPVTDIDGNVYKTVKLGNQVWMAQNLRTTRYADGRKIPLGTTESFDVAYRYYPNNNRANVSKYGYLYNWPAVMNGSASSEANPSGVQGICPDGWHVPSDAEWTELENYVSSQSQYVCSGDEDKIAKALASEVGWYNDTENCTVGCNPDANNATGFSARPAGGYYGTYHDFGDFAIFWSATQGGSNLAYYRFLDCYNAFVRKFNDSKNYGYSVRCVRN